MSLIEDRPRVAAGGATLVELRAKLAELIEVPADELEVDEPLIQIGADSLILVEAITFVEDRFGIAVKASQVIDELDTLERLAAYIDRECDDREVPRPLHQPVTVEQPVMLDQPVVVDDVVNETVPATRPPAPPKTEPTQPTSFVSWTPDDVAVATTIADDLSAPGPDLQAAFNVRLRTSKLHADRYRDPHADPRSAASFRPAIKEVVVPLILSRAKGSHLWDIDGNEYLDMASGFGSLLFGHAHGPIDDAVERQLRSGTGLGPVPFLAGPIAEEVCRLTGHDRATFVATGTEAVMLAVRLARFATGRRRIATFRGAYHGWWDGTLTMPGAARGSACRAVGGTIGEPADDVLLLPWDDDEAFTLLDADPTSLAAILIEPVQSRHPDCQPVEFIARLRRFADRHGITLVFDEMITGFRLAPGGAAERFGVQPDLSTYGKALGGGLPIGCVAGRRDLLDGVDGGTWRFGDASRPEVATTFGAGTFAKHPLSMAAAWAVLGEIRAGSTDLYTGLEARADRLQHDVNAVLAARGVEASLERCGSLLRIMSRRNLDAFFAAMIRHGVYFWEGRTMFLSTAHDDADLDRFVETCDQALDDLGVARAASVVPPSPVAAPPVELELIPNQQQLAFAYRSHTDAAQGFHNVAVVRFDGSVHVATLRDAITRLVARHDSLRTTFDMERGVEILHPEAHVELEILEVPEASPQERERLVDELIERGCTEPFDLAVGPLWRFVLVVQSPTESHLVVAGTDMVADGWSMWVVLSEVSSYYEAVRSGRAPELDPPGRLEDLRRWFASDERERHLSEALDYWDEVLAGIDTSPALPPDHHVEHHNYVKTRAKRSFDGATMARVREVARSVGVTPFSLLMGSFATMVHHVGGRDDFLLGMPTTGRVTGEQRATVASLATPVAIRIRIGATTTAAELFTDIQRQVFQAVDRAVPIDEVARRQARVTGRLTPVTPVMFNLDPLSEIPPFSDGVRMTVGSPEKTFGFLPFNAQMCPANDGSMTVFFDAAATMYDHDMVEAWMDYYLTTIDQLLERPHTVVAELALVAP